MLPGIAGGNVVIALHEFSFRAELPEPGRTGRSDDKKMKDRAGTALFYDLSVLHLLVLVPCPVDVVAQIVASAKGNDRGMFGRGMKTKNRFRCQCEMGSASVPAFVQCVQFPAGRFGGMIPAYRFQVFPANAIRNAGEVLRYLRLSVYRQSSNGKPQASAHPATPSPPARG